jgi:basic membrane lipoprotein Med (substrate-binding protein (PBP1-ABC) superfamily)
VPVNAFVKGAKDVNPDVEVKVTYIESWYDPPKAKETALAQISAGADVIYADRFGPFEACKEKGVFAFGQYVDQHDMATDVVVSSTLNQWDPCVRYVIDDWFAHKAYGTPYNAPAKEISFNMREGGCDIAPYHGLADKVPQAVKDAVAKARADILAGTLTVPYNDSPPSKE